MLACIVRMHARGGVRILVGRLQLCLLRAHALNFEHDGPL